MKHKIEIGQIFKTNSYGDVKVLSEPKKGLFEVEFTNSGYKRTVMRANLIAGKVADPTQKNPLIRDWEDCNEELVNNAGHKFTIIRRNAKKCLVVFENTKYMTECYVENAVAGKVADPYEISLYGTGYSGEFNKVENWKPIKQLWRNMMKRCYCKADTKGYYGKCFVDIRWHSFANFLDDVVNLEGYAEWANSKNTGVKYQLDKDIKIPGNKVYSREACKFVTEYENKVEPFNRNKQVGVQ